MKQKTCNSRMGRVGGQAVLEGVMMRAGTEMAVACRKQNGSISVTRTRFVSVRTRHKMLNLPIIRGAVNFVEMLKMIQPIPVFGKPYRNDRKASE